MTEKNYTADEINKKINEYFMYYTDLFKADKISFAEWTLIKTMITEIQLLFVDKGDVE